MNRLFQKIYSIFSAFALILAMVSCDKEQLGTVYSPNSDDDKEVHFIQTSITKEFEQGEQTGIVDVTLARPGNKGDYTVHLRNSNPDAFLVPEMVTIPDGKYSVEIPVEVNLASLMPGAEFSTELLIYDRQSQAGNSGAFVTQFSEKIKLNVSFSLEWEPFFREDAEGKKIQQTATYNYNAFYRGRNVGLLVEKAVGTNIYRVNDWGGGVGFRFILNEDNTCTVPAQSIGYFNSNYNQYVQVSDMAVYTKNPAAYSSYPCTYDGKSTFSFYLIYFVEEGYFAQGEETLIFEGNEDRSPVVEITFEGMAMSETGFKAPQLKFSPNAYTKFYKATVVEGDITGNRRLQEEIKTKLLEDKPLDSKVPVVTYFQENSQMWNVRSGNCTAIALAYDSTATNAVLYVQRFTCDPDNVYAPKVHRFEWLSDPADLNNSIYTTLHWRMQTSNVTKLKYLCMRSDFLEYMTSALGMTREELTKERGADFNTAMYETLNSEDGVATYFNSLSPGIPYTICVYAENSFGDSWFDAKEAKTMAYSLSDVDKTKTLEDFIGAYKAEASVAIDGTAKDETFRVDIFSLGNNDLMISGLANSTNYFPDIKAFYDPVEHLVIIETQALAKHNAAFVRLGFSNGLYTYWNNHSIALGFIDGKLRMVKSPYSEEEIFSYQFLMFREEKATSDTYMRESVGKKTYSELVLSHL